MGAGTPAIAAEPRVRVLIWLLGCAGAGGVAPALGPIGDDPEVVTLDTSEPPPPSGDCALVSDLRDANFLEGDAVRFTVECTGILATDAAAFTSGSLPPQAIFDADTRVFSWATGPADGGRYDIDFSILPRDGSADVADAGTVTIWVADDPSNADNIAVVPKHYTEEWGLPVVHVSTEATPDTSAYSDATVTWYGREYPAGIQVHGKTSTHYPKLSYALKFSAAELPIDAWGVRRDHLLLITTFDDNSYVRQKFTYDLWAAMAAYWGQPRLTPRALFSVVYMNGAYLGLYTAEDRVDDEFADHMGFDRDGNIYKAVDIAANYSLTDAEGVEKTSYHQGFDKMEGEPADDFTDLDALVNFTGHSTAAQLVAGAGEWIDLNEWLDALTLLLYVNGEDSYLKNIYLYHATGGVFRYAPWDFNASWGQNWRTYRVRSTFIDGDASTNRIFAALLNDSSASATMWERFGDMRANGPFSETWQTTTLDNYFGMIDRSAQRDWDAWGETYKTYIGWATSRDSKADWTDYEGEKAYVYQWVSERAAYFQTTHP